MQVFNFWVFAFLNLYVAAVYVGWLSGTVTDLTTYIRPAILGYATIPVWIAWRMGK
jgi:hypothetical protein